jgi:hypothetical protein
MAKCCDCTSLADIEAVINRLLVHANILFEPLYDGSVQVLLDAGGSDFLYSNRAWTARLEAALWCLIRQENEPAFDCQDAVANSLSQPLQRSACEEYSGLCASILAQDAGFDCDFDVRFADSQDFLQQSENINSGLRIQLLIDLYEGLSGGPVGDLEDVVSNSVFCCVGIQYLPGSIAYIAGFAPGIELAPSVPADAILEENSDPILEEAGAFLLEE